MDLILLIEANEYFKLERVWWAFWFVLTRNKSFIENWQSSTVFFNFRHVLVEYLEIPWWLSILLLLSYISQLQHNWS